MLTPGRYLDHAGSRTLPFVNSLHRHALVGPGRFRVIAEAPDGVIEAFEGETHGFCLGVQWHPEYGLTPLDAQVFEAFASACAA